MPGYIKQGCLLIALGLLAGGCGERAEPKWYRGNLHTHSYWSDGDNYPEMIMRWYKSRGYDFVALSDHDRLAEGEKWIEFPPGSVRDSVFRAYRDAFGEEWVTSETGDSLRRVRLKTLREYRTLFEEEGEFLIVRSEEISDGYGGKPIHLNATNIQEAIAPQGGNSVVEVMQNNIDAVHAQSERTGEPIIPHLNHPNYHWTVSAADLKQLERERFFEVYNGHPSVQNFGDSEHPSTERMWDEVNTHYLREGKPPLFGLAVDDAHNYHTFDSSHSNPGRGWIRVWSRGLGPDALIAAMMKGRFYASSGVRVTRIRADSAGLSLSIEGEKGVSYRTRFIGTLREEPGRPGVVLEEVTGTNPSYTFTGAELFVRATIQSDKPKENPYSAGETEAAWIQPVVPGTDRHVMGVSNPAEND